MMRLLISFVTIAIRMLVRCAVAASGRCSKRPAQVMGIKRRGDPPRDGSPSSARYLPALCNRGCGLTRSTSRTHTARGPAPGTARKRAPGPVQSCRPRVCFQSEVPRYPSDARRRSIRLQGGARLRLRRLGVLRTSAFVSLRLAGGEHRRRHRAFNGTDVHHCIMYALRKAAEAARVRASVAWYAEEGTLASEPALVWETTT
jgi:hypothetical protein